MTNEQKTEHFKSLITFNTPIQLDNNLIIVVDWNFNWGFCEVYEETDKLYNTMLIYPKTFNCVKQYMSMKRIVKLIETSRMNNNLYEKLLEKIW